MSRLHQPFLWIISFVFISIISSCFEIVEEVDLNDDGTGRFSFTINMKGNFLILPDEIFTKLDLSNRALIDTGKIFSEATEEEKALISKIKAEEEKKLEDLKDFLKGK